MKKIFKNAEFQSQFERDGFIVLNLLTEKQTQILSDFFYSNHSLEGSKGFLSDSYLLDKEKKRYNSEFIVSVIQDSFEEVFTDYKIFGGSYLYKMPDELSELAAHQDWTIVDESQFCALNCWIPLVDTDIKNGTLQVIPGTHFSSYKSFRAPTLPFFFNRGMNLIHHYLIPLTVSKGSVVILDQSIIHYSGVNKSKHVRPALTVGVKSSQARMQFYYYKNELLKTYAMDEDFLISFEDFDKSIYKEPNGKLINEYAFKPELLNPFQVAAVFDQCTRKKGLNKFQVFMNTFKF